MFAADKPIRHVEDDKYGREKYVDNLAYALLTGDDSDGLVVGIEGAWGSGKTSLKNMLIERLQQMPLPDRKTHLIEFDAWMYSRSGEIVSALFSEISAGLSPRLKWYQKLLMRFDCFNNNAITSVVHLIYRAINAVLPYSEIGISIGCISWSFQNLSKNIAVDEEGKRIRVWTLFVKFGFRKVCGRSSMCFIPQSCGPFRTLTKKRMNVFPLSKK